MQVIPNEIPNNLQKSKLEFFNTLWQAAPSKELLVTVCTLANLPMAAAFSTSQQNIGIVASVFGAALVGTGIGVGVYCCCRNKRPEASPLFIEQNDRDYHPYRNSQSSASMERKFGADTTESSDSEYSDVKLDVEAPKIFQSPKANAPSSSQPSPYFQNLRHSYSADRITYIKPIGIESDVRLEDTLQPFNGASSLPPPLYSLISDNPPSDVPVIDPRNFDTRYVDETIQYDRI
ncbi:MAG: hypothetical protein K0R08_116 [Solimicrobium sp.]|jgi:hypothetical protein|nr:hypothetical protein [Solimicrobium sp.]